MNILYWEQKELNNARACVHGEALKSVGFADCGCIFLPPNSLKEIYLVVYKVVYAGATQYTRIDYILVCEFRYITETWFHVKLYSDPANLLTKWISLSGVLQQSATTQTQERIWPILSFVRQKLVTINQFEK